MSSIYTSEAGEWKLSGLEVLTNLKEDENAIFVRIPRFPLSLSTSYVMWRMFTVDVWEFAA